MNLSGKTGTLGYDQAGVCTDGVSGCGPLCAATGGYYDPEKGVYNSN